MMPRKSTRRFPGCSPSWPTVALAVAVLFTTCNVLVTWYTLARLNALLPPPSTEREYTWVGDDVPKELPIAYEPALVTFEDPGPHLSLYDDAEWGTLFPTDGSVRGGETNRTFLVAMTHQLHCLDVIRVGYVTNASDFRGHIEHCLRYLVQTVQCFGDTTLEEDEMVFIDGEWFHAVYVWGTQHKCRDRTMLEKYMIENEGIPRIPENPPVLDPTK